MVVIRVLVLIVIPDIRPLLEPVRRKRTGEVNS
jgi:hypothetical protein